MTVLIVPTTVKRLLPRFEQPKPGKWHIYKQNPNKSVCGVTMCEQPTYHWEFSTIDQVRARDLCKECWPFEARDE